MPTYQGLDLLTIRPNRGSAWETTVERPADTFASPQGNVVTSTTTAPSTEGRTLVWGCITRAERAAVETFLASRVGQLVACWIPDPQWQFPILAQDGTQVLLNPGSSGESLEARITADEAWQHWMGRVTSSTDYTARQFTTVTDNGDGTYLWHVLSGSGPLAANDPTAVYSRLYRCRMASDAYRVTYLTGNVTEIAADFVEVAA